MGLLDESKYNFADPYGVELLNTLAQLYQPRKAQSLALSVAGLRTERIDFTGSAYDVWQNILDATARAGHLRGLATVIIQDPESAGAKQLLQRLLEDVPKPLPPGVDQYSLVMLPSRRAFINRLPLRAHLREFSDPDGARVLLVKGASGLGKSHSWHLISFVGDRVGAYEAHRFNLTGWTGPKQSASQVMDEITAELGWKPADVRPGEQQPDTTVRLLVITFKNRARNLAKPICLVFDGYTSSTADEWARRLIVGIAAAANEDQNTNARVVLLEVEAPLPEELARDALPENLHPGRRSDLPEFFRAAAAGVGERADDEAMEALVNTVLGPPPHRDEFSLQDIGPRAAQVASAAFRRDRNRAMPDEPVPVGGAEIRRRLADIQDSLAAPPDDVVSEPRRRLRSAAVLRGCFNAGDLAARARGAGGDIADADLQSFIQHDCEPVSSARGTGWQLSLAVRHETVRHLGGDIAGLLETTRDVPADAADLGRTMAERYLRGEAPAVEEQTADQLAGSLLAVGWLSGADLELPTESRLRLQLQLRDLLQPLRFVTDGPVVGRSAELTRLADYVDGPNDHYRHPLVIYGPGGMGKSTVVARFLLDRSASSRPSRVPFAYLTFDRADLLPQRPLGVLAEMIRQLNLQLPDVSPETGGVIAALEQAQRGIVSTLQEQSKGRVSRGTRQRRGRDEQRLIDQFARVVNWIGTGSVVCVLDTFERAQRQGFAAVEQLLDILYAVRSAAPSLKIVIAGRADIPGYGTEKMPLAGLKPSFAVQYLRVRVGAADVAESLLKATAKRVGGNPLSLRLVADLMCREIEALHTAAGQRRFLLSLEGDVIQGVLYRRVLGHIDDLDVRALAIPGLALRRITPEVIEKVLAPCCGLGTISPRRARELFRKLRNETSLVTDDGNVLIHRADLRQDVLPLLQSEDPAGVASIHRHAIRFYSTRHSVADRTEELYHRLALGQAAKTVDRRWEDEAGARLDAALDEFPAAGQVYLASRLGFQADPAALQAVDDEAWARQAIRSARSYLDAGNPQAALDILRQRPLSITVFDHAALEVETLARLGQSLAAQKLVARAREAATEAGKPAEFVRFSLLGAQISEDSGHYQRALTISSEAREIAQASEDPVNALVAGVGMLRALRRSQRDSTRRARSLRAQVKTEALELSRRQRTANPLLVRDLAAEFGADLPQFVIEASKAVGVDVESPEARQTLISEGREASVAKAAEILEASRPERPADDEPGSDYEPDTSHEGATYEGTSYEQGEALGSYLEGPGSDDSESFEAVSDFLKSETDQPTFGPDDS